eukprot:15455831-Alexandrium_andersonii.AAC.1
MPRRRRSGPGRARLAPRHRLRRAGNEGCRSRRRGSLGLPLARGGLLSVADGWAVPHVRQLLDRGSWPAVA